RGDRRPPAGGRPAPAGAARGHRRAPPGRPRGRHRRALRRRALARQLRRLSGLRTRPAGDRRTAGLAPVIHRHSRPRPEDTPMRRIALLALLALALPHLAAAVPPPNNAVPSHYTLWLDPDIGQGTLGGRESIDVALAK